jgi:hypothetical protein
MGNEQAGRRDVATDGMGDKYLERARERSRRGEERRERESGIRSGGGTFVSDSLSFSLSLSPPAKRLAISRTRGRADSARRRALLRPLQRYRATVTRIAVIFGPRCRLGTSGVRRDRNRQGTVTLHTYTITGRQLRSRDHLRASASCILPYENPVCLHSPHPSRILYVRSLTPCLTPNKRYPWPRLPCDCRVPASVTSTATRSVPHWRFRSCEPITLPPLSPANTPGSFDNTSLGLESPSLLATPLYPCISPRPSIRAPRQARETSS